METCNWPLPVTFMNPAYIVSPRVVWRLKYRLCSYPSIDGREEVTFASNSLFLGLFNDRHSSHGRLHEEERI